MKILSAPIMKQLFLWKELIIVCISVIVVFHTALYFFNRDKWKQYSYPEYFATVSFPQPPTEDVRTVQVEGIGPRKSVTYYSRDAQKNYYFFGHISYPKEKGTISYQDRMNKMANVTAQLGFDITKTTPLECEDNVRCSVVFEGVQKSKGVHIYGIRILVKEHFYQAYVLSKDEVRAHEQGRIFIDSIQVSLGIQNAQSDAMRVSFACSNDEHVYAQFRSDNSVYVEYFFSGGKEIYELKKIGTGKYVNSAGTASFITEGDKILSALFLVNSKKIQCTFETITHNNG